MNSFASQARRGSRGGIYVNDVHSALNASYVEAIARPSSLPDLQMFVRNAARMARPISICGRRHAMGGQQFGNGLLLLDMGRLNRGLTLDMARGLVTVEAGMTWPELMDYLALSQFEAVNRWTIRQKQTGADRLSLGGALSANIHGRGLRMKPFIADIESFMLIDAHGEMKLCNRSENAELFRLAIGGYGLFGIVYALTLRLQWRFAVERKVDIARVNDLARLFETQTQAGSVYGDLQFSVDDLSGDFLQRGIFSCYRPIEIGVAFPKAKHHLSPEDWKDLLYLAHVDKSAAFKKYSDFYLSTNGQVYPSDSHQFNFYQDHYHAEIDRRTDATVPGSEMITELFVPLEDLGEFMKSAARFCKSSGANVIYGTVRLIQRDDESFLAWARRDFACVIFNLHVDHTEIEVARAAKTFRGLIDLAIRFGGSFYLTYHKWASRGQVEKCYPQFKEFLRLKQKFDSKQVFTSDWHRHYSKLFNAR